MNIFLPGPSRVVMGHPRKSVTRAFLLTKPLRSTKLVVYDKFRMKEIRMYEIFRMRLRGGWMNVRNPAGGRSPAVEIEYGLAYEFLMSLSVFFEQKGYEYELDREWFDAARTKVTPDLLNDIPTFLSA